MLTDALDDAIPEERDLGIAAGFAWRHVAHVTVVYLDLGMSRGMELGIEAAEAMGHPIERRRLGEGWDAVPRIEVGCEVEWQPLYADGRKRGTVTGIESDGTIRIAMPNGRGYFDAHERHRLTVVRPAPTRTPSVGMAVRR